MSKVITADPTNSEALSPSVATQTPKERPFSTRGERAYPARREWAFSNRWEWVKGCEVTAFCLLLSAFCLSCGYQVAGRADRLPPDIKTIAVPTFLNQSPTFRIEQKLAAAVTREFVERTKFRITANPADADAVLKGTVKEVRKGVITYNLTTGNASSFQIQVTADIKLEDLHSKKVVYANPNFVFREEYQVSQTTAGLFEEDQAALDRLSRDVARTLVTDLLENF